MTVIFTEDWTGTNGAAWPSHWTHQAVAGSPPAPDIQSNQGRVFRAGTGDRPRYIHYVNDQNAEDVNIKVEWTTPDGSISLGAVARRADGASTTLYLVHRRRPQAGTANTFEILKSVAGVNTALGNVAADQLLTDTMYGLRFYVQDDGAGGTDLKAREWLVSSGEDATWDIEVNGDTEASLQGVSGRFGLQNEYIESNFGASDAVFFDDMEVDDFAVVGGATGHINLPLLGVG